MAIGRMNIGKEVSTGGKAPKLTGIKIKIKTKGKRGGR